MSWQLVLGIILLAAGVVLGLVALAAWLIGRGDRSDPLGLPAPDYTSLGSMPPEIAHDDPFTPLTSPAVPPASAPLASTPGTAAAAGDLRPPESPSPLPQVIARYPEHFPFTAWLDDKVAEAGHAIRGGA